MVCKHQSTDAMIRGYVWRAARQRNLNGRRPPRDEVGKLALTDAQERLVYLYHMSTSGLGQEGCQTYVGGVDIALNDVENRDVARRLAGYGRDHPVLRL